MREQRADQLSADVQRGEDLDLPAPMSAANAAGIFAEGSRFGAYVLGPCIGHGETGRLYRAEHEAIRGPLALKVFTDDFARTALGRNRFLREARQAATVRHPSLVDIFDVGVREGVPYLVRELLDGEDLEVLLHAGGALDEGAIVDLMVPVVAGLAALHDADIVHGGLKTANVFLAQRPHRGRDPKLLDFGISRSLTGEKLGRASGTRGLFRGNPLYAAPEIVRGAAPSALSDQYSLGVIMYECAVGVNPFGGQRLAEALRRIAQGEFPALSQHEARPSEPLVRIVERAMSLDPGQRYPDLKALGRDLLLLASERTRMTWTLSFGDSRGAQLVRQRGAGVWSWLSGVRERRPLEGRVGWVNLGAVLFGLITFAAAVAILLWR